MPRALILNPNTSSSVTTMLVEHVTAMLGVQDKLAWQVLGVTASFGAEYIASETAYAIAAHAALDAFAQTAPGSGDVVLIGCFGDPGLEALREISPVPVIGLAEAAMKEAAEFGRFAIVTGGPRWAPILRRRAQAAGLAAQLARSYILKESGAELAADREAAIGLLATACEEAMEVSHPDAIILGGAALAGIGDLLADHLGLPVIDSVSAAARAMQKAVANPTASIGPDGVDYHGLSPALAQRLRKTG
ncbi:aspartate/glutamate racemase family protein [Uliginosibacterium sp. H3]|uniref:Aspartate/glutamate racemase family protein n=1 Tax=Uliginosibacterium silvisoli TaxID=3114758 RepID=A0ABU6JXG7_9RHOO|nr:aspartate/glutamate racemase family protein [Uliginosibacterium sp. H3]